MSGLSAFLAACGGAEGSAERAEEAPEAKAVSHPKTAIGDWTFSNWPLYIDKKVLRDFEREYGGKVHYIEDINDNNEFFGKVRQPLEQGRPIGRDLVVLTDWMAARWVRSATSSRSTSTTSRTRKNLVPNLRTVNFDPERKYTLPWQSGATGIGYNLKKTGRELNSVKELFDPKFKGRVTLALRAPRLGRPRAASRRDDAAKATIDDVLAAIEKIDKANDAGQIRRFTGNDYTTDLTKGNVWVAVAYSGDIIQLKADNPDLDFVIPEEGAILWSDNMMIPQKARQPVRRRDDHELRLRARGRGADRRVRELRHAGRRACGRSSRRDPRSSARRPADLPARRRRGEAAPPTRALAEEEQQMNEAMAKVTGA